MPENEILICTNLRIISSRDKCMEHIRESKASNSFRMTIKLMLDLEYKTRKCSIY